METIVPPVTVHVGATVPEPVVPVPVFIGTVQEYVELVIVGGLLLRFVAHAVVGPEMIVVGGIGLTKTGSVTEVTVPAPPTGSACVMLSDTLTDDEITFGHTGVVHTTVIDVPEFTVIVPPGATVQA